MKKLLILGGMLAASALTSFGGTVFYNTSATQLCIGASGCGVTTQTIGGITVTYNPIVAGSVDADPSSFGSLGEVIIACVGGGTSCGSQSLAGLNLYINIGQTGPSVGSANMVVGVFSGSVAGASSSGQLTWAIPNLVSIGVVDYSVFSNPRVLVSPSTNNGVSSLEGLITDNTPPPTSDVPEPASMALISAGLLGIGLLGRRKRR